MAEPNNNNSFTKANGASRTTVSLAKYIDEISDAQTAKCAACRKGIDASFVTSDQAVLLARDMVDREFRAITKATDLARDNMEERLTSTKEEYTKAHEVLVERINSLEISRAEIAGKASQKLVYVSWVLGSAGLILGFIGLILRFVH